MSEGPIYLSEENNVRQNRKWEVFPGDEATVIPKVLQLVQDAVY